jgi:hypothetical protein
MEKTRWIAKATIPHILDWDTHLTLWPKIMSAPSSELQAEQLWGEKKPEPIEQHDIGGGL